TDELYGAVPDGTTDTYDANLTDYTTAGLAGTDTLNAITIWFNIGYSFAAAASVVHDALPIAYYLGMAYTGADPLWMKEVLPFRPDPDTAAWLAWLDAPASIAPPAGWGGWLHLGLSRADVLLAVGSKLPIERM
ncbi:MAG: hypothetical protein V4479_06880, partial [Actinomycetota bacterium]